MFILYIFFSIFDIYIFLDISFEALMSYGIKCNALNLDSICQNFAASCRALFSVIPVNKKGYSSP